MKHYSESFNKLVRLFDGLHSAFDLSSGAEVTIESAPDTLRRTVMRTFGESIACGH
jgi:coproporphyrinogen III oxidase-like Fe-S oxidoreductase